MAGDMENTSQLTDWFKVNLQNGRENIDDSKYFGPEVGEAALTHDYPPCQLPIPAIFPNQNMGWDFEQEAISPPMSSQPTLVNSDMSTPSTSSFPESEWRKSPWGENGFQSPPSYHQVPEKLAEQPSSWQHSCQSVRFRPTFHEIDFNIEAGLIVKVGNQWHRAIFHDDFVEALDFDLLNPGQYRHGRSVGRFGTYDITSYRPDQQDWGSDRPERPDILFELEDKRTEQLQPIMSLTYFDLVDGQDRVVIDTLNKQPLRAFPFLPATICSDVEGWLMESYFRLDPRLTNVDLIQRMPIKQMGIKSISQQDRHRLTKRRVDFRLQGRLLSWDRVSHKSRADRKLLEELSPEDHMNNTTRNLKDLTRKELAQLTAENKESGRFAKRGRPGQAKAGAQGRIRGFQTEQSDMDGDNRVKRRRKKEKV